MIKLCRKTLFLLLAIVLSFSGCMHAPNLNQTLFNLNPPLTAIPAYSDSGKTLLILPMEAIEEIDTTNMAYTEKPNQIAYYAKHRWVATPPQMLMPLMASALRKTKVFKAVVFAPFIGVTDLRLTTQLLAFKQNFLHHPSTWEVVLSAQLVNAKTDKIIASRVFSATSLAPMQSPNGGVIAANQATGSVLQQLARWVAERAG